MSVVDHKLIDVSEGKRPHRTLEIECVTCEAPDMMFCMVDYAGRVYVHSDRLRDAFQIDLPELLT